MSTKLGCRLYHEGCPAAVHTLSRGYIHTYTTTGASGRRLPFFQSLSRSLKESGYRNEGGVVIVTQLAAQGMIMEVDLLQARVAAILVGVQGVVCVVIRVELFEGFGSI